MTKAARNSERIGGGVNWRKRIALLVLLVLAAGLAWHWRSINAQSQAGVSYAARVGCSCHFVAGRELSDCRKDFLPGMGLVMLSENKAQQSVTARIFPLVSQTASYDPASGCVLEPSVD